MYDDYMTVLGVALFKATCLQVLDKVARTGEEVIITKRGKAIARVVPNLGLSHVYPQTSLKGSAKISGDILAPAVPVGDWEVLRGIRAATAKRRKR